MTEPHLSVARPSGGLAVATCVLLSLSCVAIGLVGATEWMELGLVQQVIAGGEVTEDQVTANDIRQGLAALLMLGGLLTTAVVFLVWIFHANKAARALGAEGMSITPGWSVWWWFVPFANLVKPYQAVGEIWRASTPDPAYVGGNWRESPSTPMLPAWWACWIISGIVSNLATRAQLRSEDAETYLTSIKFSLGADVIQIVAGMLLIQIIRGITSRQQALYGVLAEASAVPDEAGAQAPGWESIGN
jgi:hypothetical protein